MSDSSSGADPFDALAHEFAGRFRRGERPALSEYTDRYPELADQIRELFPALIEIEQLDSGARPEIGPFPPAATAVSRVLGDYRVIREIGRGGMGVVYEAVQESLGRHVALKVLPARRTFAAGQLERFIREAKAAAGLHHTNIVPVFGVGAHEGVHYYAMQFIEGQGLDAVLAEVRRLRRGAADGLAETPRPDDSLAISIAHGLVTGRFPDPRPRPEPDQVATTEVDPFDKPVETGPRPPTGSTGDGLADSTASILGRTEAHYHRSVARLGVQVGDALAYAHAHGVLHRDIKPANLLLDLQGTAWVTDFGLAKAEGSDELTSPGDIIGTLRYMAPERFRGQSDARSDVYGLGLTLYEMLTTEPAFAAADRARLIDLVRHAEPARPRKLDPRIPRNLETIVLKAMQKDPADRYATAEELAEELRRFLEDRPIRARRSSKAEQALRWHRRNRLVATLLWSLFLSLVGGFVGMSRLYFEAERHRRLAEGRLGELAGNYHALGKYSRNAPTFLPPPDSDRWFYKAIEIYETLARDDPDSDALQLSLVESYRDLGKFYETRILSEGPLLTRRMKQAAWSYRKAIAIHDRLARRNPNDQGLGRKLARAYFDLAYVEHEAGEPAEAVRGFRRAAVAYESLARARPDDYDAQLGLARSYRNLGFVEHEAGDTAAAVGALRRAVDAYEPLAKDHSSKFDREELSHAYFDLGMSQREAGQLAEAAGSLRGAIDSYRSHTLPFRVARMIDVGRDHEMFERHLRTGALQSLARHRGEVWEVTYQTGPRAGYDPDRDGLAASSFELGLLLDEIGRPAEALNVWSELCRRIESFDDCDTGDLLNLARALALSSAATGGDLDRAAVDRTRRRALAGRAMDALRRAASGLKDGAQLQRDPLLAALRPYPDFQLLLMDLAFPTEPFAR